MRAALRFDADDERLARIAWSRVASPGDTRARRLVAEHGGAGGLRRVLDGTADPVGVARWTPGLAEVDPAPDLRLAARMGGRVVVPGDDAWPSALDDLGSERPYCLWARGPLDPAVLTPERAPGPVSIVGTRTPTEYGLDVARQLAEGCAQAGVAVVSGAAIGIDAEAHRGVLAAGGTAVAVMPCSLDRVYPVGNARLVAAVARTGLLLSEVPPGNPTTRGRLLDRNRLVAALGSATVVVEAGWRSGSQHTARRAAELSRPVGAVPGPVTSTMSAGCHRLLRDGAVCVTDVAEVLELLGPVGSATPRSRSVPWRDHDGLEPEQVLVLDALPVRDWALPESVARVAALPVGEVLATLGHLSGRGLAETSGGRWRRDRSGEAGAGGAAGGAAGGGGGG